MKLYNYWRSSSSWRVRIALAHKHIPYDYVPVHLLQNGGQQFDPVFLAKNPMAQVPVLELDSGDTIAQSSAIMRYLEETHPEQPLTPKDAVQRACMDQIVELINSGIQPFQNISVQKFIRENYQTEPKSWLQHFLSLGMEALEKMVAKTKGRFCVGDQVTFADLCLVPQMESSRRFEVSVDRYPLLLEIEKACQALPAFVTTHPNRQIDTPDEARR
jgi:maleylpyruvate isomerase